MSRALEKYLNDHGKSQKWLADQLGIKPPSVNEWLKRGIPPARVPRISELTGLSMHELRPDIYPQQVA